MSIQSDTEMLAIQTMELYAKRNKLLPHEVNELFHKHQIFEKIIIQHEYLHQVSLDEVMGFVESSLKEETRELILFHGTVSDFGEIQLVKSHNRRDFGIGFYTTLLEQQAKEWAYRLSLREKKNTYYVYQFVFMESDTLKIQRFEALNKEWLEFIKENRSKGGLQHDNDIVIGPVANDNTMETVQLYIAGILTVDVLQERLNIDFVEAIHQFYDSETYITLQNTQNGLWAESAEYIADRFFEEKVVAKS